jgi:type IV pilus assembly protein PilB
VLRLLDRTRSLHRLDDLGMPADTYQSFLRVVRAPFGMVICAGPTGSGKTTTLYATLAEINQSERNITTIEDPVEYVFSSINQIQINEQSGITFASGLRSILRQDPDVILVGEIRDVETARIAVQSALSGHFVLSSLHATDAAAALLRFVDMGIESFLVASSVAAVVSQRLVRRTCAHCRVAHSPSVEELAFYREAGGPPKTTFSHGEGCNFCSHTGYCDRIGVYELLPVSDDIKELLVSAAPHDRIYRSAMAAGMRSLLDEGVRLVAEDITTIAEIMRAIYTI